MATSSSALPLDCPGTERYVVVQNSGMKQSVQTTSKNSGGQNACAKVSTTCSQHAQLSAAVSHRQAAPDTVCSADARLHSIGHLQARERAALCSRQRRGEGEGAGLQLRKRHRHHHGAAVHPLPARPMQQRAAGAVLNAAHGPVCAQARAAQATRQVLGHTCRRERSSSRYVSPAAPRAPERGWPSRARCVAWLLAPAPTRVPAPVLGDHVAQAQLVERAPKVVGVAGIRDSQHARRRAARAQPLRGAHVGLGVGLSTHARKERVQPLELCVLRQPECTQAGRARCR